MGICDMEQFLLWVTNRHGNLSTELIKPRALCFWCQMWDVTLKWTTVSVRDLERLTGERDDTDRWVWDLNM